MLPWMKLCKRILGCRAEKRKRFQIAHINLQPLQKLVGSAFLPLHGPTSSWNHDGKSESECSKNATCRIWERFTAVARLSHTSASTWLLELFCWHWRTSFPPKGVRPNFHTSRLYRLLINVLPRLLLDLFVILGIKVRVNDDRVQRHTHCSRETSDDYPRVKSPRRCLHCRSVHTASVTTHATINLGYLEVAAD